MNRNSASIDEILRAVPERTVEHLEREEGLVTLLRPKFLSPRLAWLQRRLRRPHFKVKLDAVGTCLWVHMDGKRSGFELVEILRLAFGEPVEPADERTAKFLVQLAQGNFVRLK